MLLGLFLTSCDKEKTNPLDSSLNQPIVSWVQVTPETVMTDSIAIGSSNVTIQVTAQTKIIDNEGVADLKQVKFRIVKQGSSSILAEGTMHYDSTGSSLTEGYYSVNASFRIQRQNVGAFSFETYAIAGSGLSSNSAFHKINITRSNRAPVISNLFAPDTITLPPAPYAALFNMYVSAMDSDGTGDIEQVYFRNLDSPSDTNRHFVLFDDGVQSSTQYDSLSNDGIFSAKFQLPWNTPPQTYRFEFAATDQLGAISNRILKYIVVRQP